MADKLPQPIEELMELAWNEAKQARAEAVEPVHLFIALCKQNLPPIARVFEEIGVDPVKLRRRVRGFARALGAKQNRDTERVSGRVARILKAAQERAGEGKPMLVADVMGKALLDPDKDLQAVIEGELLPVKEMLRLLVGESSKPDAAKAEAKASAGGGTLEKLGKDYTQLARDGKLDPVIGRRDELKQIIRVLLRKQKNNPVLVGEAGVGKTSIIEGLALYAVSGDAPEAVRRMQIIEVPIASLVAGAKYRGDLEQRLQNIVASAEADPNIVIFIDEIHTIVGAGASGDAMDAANILKPALARGAMRCIGATTPAEYARYIEKDAALERRFQPIRVEEPSPAEAREILAGLRPSYEKYHQVRISDAALDAAVELSVKYLPDRRLPDKARDLLDQAAVSQRVRTLSPRALNEAAEITREDVAEVVAEWTGIPVEKLAASERDRLARLEDVLRERVVGQDHAIEAVARVVRAALTGLAPTNRPYGVFLFTGPTGVGKTELAKALAQFLFDDERKLLRFDMSEYMEEHSVSKLIGSPPGYVGHEEGGRLTDAVRRNPYSVVLFDEIEKSHPKVADLFLQIFDDGRLTDSRGRTADFRNTIIILTSNVSTAPPPKAVRVGFKEVGAAEPQHEAAPDPRAALVGRFRPELLNRLSAIVQFHPLSAAHARAIVDKALGSVRRRLGDRRIELQVTEAGYDALVTIGFHPQFGARELERVVEREVVQPLAEGIVAGRWRDGSAVTVDADGPRIRVRSAEDDDMVSGAVLKTLLQPAADEDVALLLLDIEKSTGMLMDQGDTAFVATVRRLHSLVNEDPVRFLKGTGDGFLVVYSDLQSALHAADRIRTRFSGEAVRIRFILHTGRVKVGPGGDPLGREVHRLFRIESASASSGGALIISDRAAAHLPPALRSRFRRGGELRLEGFEEPEAVWVEG